jgi:hypothetical protein
MKVDVAVRTYRGGAAQRWQRLSGNGRSPRGLAFLVMADVGVCHAFASPLFPPILQGQVAPARGFPELSVPSDPAPCEHAFSARVR